MNSIRASLAVPIVLLGFASVHCSSTTTGNGAGSGDGGSSGSSAEPGDRTGITPCGNFPDQVAKTCQAGQHCTDERISQCQAGCLTDNNCPKSATCSLETSTGICKNVAPAPSKVSCDDLCKHIQACVPSVTAAQCAQICAGYNDACKACLLNANCSAPKSACDAECK